MIKEPKLSETDFKYFTTLIYQQTGIKLTEQKRPMLQTRLMRRLRSLNLRTYHEYINYLKKHPTEKINFINSLTTNKTDFFREMPHFDFLIKKFLPALVKNNPQGRKIAIWSAACSSGPEVYTLAMIMENFVSDHPKFDYCIYGTDIDTEILDAARAGIYPSGLVSKVPKNYLVGNFEKGRGTNRGLYRVSAKIKKKVIFQQFNLIDANNSMPLTFDVVFLRNVLIYFPPEVIQQVIEKICKYLKKDGLLFLGHSENLGNIEHNLTLLGAAIYKKTGT